MFTLNIYQIINLIKIINCTAPLTIIHKVNNSFEAVVGIAIELDQVTTSRIAFQ